MILMHFCLKLCRMRRETPPGGGSEPDFIRLSKGKLKKGQNLNLIIDLVYQLLFAVSPRQKIGV